MFKLNQKVIYPAHGVALVQDIFKRDIGGKSKEFYRLKVINSGMTIMVPVANASTLRLRSIVSKTELSNIFKDLAFKLDTTRDVPWNVRYRDYMERLKSGSIYETATVLRGLLALKQTKDLSFGERKMLEQVKVLLSLEIAAVLDLDYDDAEQKLLDTVKDLNS